MQIIAFGDTILENNFFKSESYENFIELFSKADLVTYNLETVVSDRTLMENDKAVCFKISIKNIDMFHNRIGKQVVCNIANNHTMDYQRRGFTDTINAIDMLNTIYTGKHEQVVFLSVGQFRFAIIGAYEDTSNDEINHLDSQLLDCVTKAAYLVDFCILHVHWGRELSIGISYNQKEWAHKLIDAGADIIIGHHPHVLQGIESYHNKLIFYSLGNFQIPINPYEKMSQYSIIVQININDNRKINYSYIPIQLDENGIPFPGDLTCHKVVHNILKEADKEVYNFSKIRYYLNFSLLYIKESYRAWKIRSNKREKRVYIKIVRWLFSDMTLKAVLFAIVDIILGYTKKRKKRIWSID